MSPPIGPNLCIMIMPRLFVEPIQDLSIGNLKRFIIILENDDKCRGCNRLQSNFRYQTVLNFSDEMIYFSGFVHRRTSWLPLCSLPVTYRSYPTWLLRIPRIFCRIWLPCGMTFSPRRPYPSRRPNVPIFGCLRCSCPPLLAWATR